jgi:glycosyltransferase involved in cell wall biosynthesis
MSLKENLSVIVPVYNEEWNIIPLFSEIQKSIADDFKWHDYEIILVNDGSTDKTRKELVEIKENNWNTIIINLQRNYWQSIALEVWFENCSWDIIVTLDWDWQNNPKDIKKLYDKMNNEWFDVVAWWRKSRKDSFLIKWITKCARFFRKLLIHDKIHDSWCTLRIYKKECIEDVHLWWEMHRYIAEILTIKWYKVWELQVNHRKRVHWVSKYTWKKSIKWFIDLVYIWFIAKYQSRPLHLFWWIGLLTFFVWLLSFFFSIYQKIWWWLSINRSWYFLIWVFLIQTWIMIFIFWIVIDILIRIYHNWWIEKRYKIKEIMK